MAPMVRGWQRVRRAIGPGRFRRINPYPPARNSGGFVSGRYGYRESAGHKRHIAQDLDDLAIRARFQPDSIRTFLGIGPG